MRILIASTGVPFPPTNGGLLRTYHLTRSLCQTHDVTLVCFSFEKYEEASLPVRVIEVPWELPPLYDQMSSSDEAVADAATRKLQYEVKEPWLASFYDSKAMEEALRREIPKNDLIIFEGTDTARFISLVPEAMPVILDFMDVCSAMWLRDSARLPLGSKERKDADHEVSRIIAYEKELAQRATLSLVCSELEAEHARKLFGVDNFYVFPNGVDTSFHVPTEKTPDPHSFIFVGTLNYQPNVEAVHYFAKDIFPRIRREMPDAKFHIVGSRVVKSIEKLGELPGVIFHGHVEDIRPYCYRAAVSVIPILSGGGTRLKILEGAAQGRAMVSTTIGAEGLQMHDGSELLIADTTEDFVKKAIKLARDASLRRELGCKARHASLNYDWKKIETEFNAFFEKQKFVQEPLVSIIVNNYNYGRFVGEAIESALNQTYPNVEVIVVDDGSTDNSREVISRYAGLVKTIFKENGGQTSSLNAGFAKSRGEIIVFLDADDQLSTDVIERIVPMLSVNHENVRVHWPLWVVDAGGRKTNERIPHANLDEGDLRDKVLKKGPDAYCFAPTSGNAWSRRFLNSVFPLPEVERQFGIGSASADAYLSMLAPFYGKIRSLSRPHGFYRIHGGNSSKRSFDEKMRRGLLKFDFRKMALLDFLKEKGIHANTEDWKSGQYELKQALEEIEAFIPSSDRFVLVDDENWAVNETVFKGRQIPFLERHGQYWGPPSDDETALKELERLRSTVKANFLVIASPSFWWLEHYQKFASHLELKYRRIIENERIVIFDLRLNSEAVTCK